MRLSGKTAIVSGASSGIGQAIARRLAQEEAEVLGFDIAVDREATWWIEEEKRSITYGDASNYNSVKAVLSIGVFRSKRLDILVNCAAHFAFGSVENVDEAEMEKLWRVNVLGYHNCVRAALPYMKEGGAILNIASISGFLGEGDGHYPYSMTKAAIISMTKCLAVDLASRNIRVNAICPGPILTQASRRHMATLGLTKEDGIREFGKETLMKRMGQPEEVAAAALFLVSDEASFITGECLVVDGGASVD